jgi:hypothetical protein
VGEAGWLGVGRPAVTNPSPQHMWIKKYFPATSYYLDFLIKERDYFFLSQN